MRATAPITAFTGGPAPGVQTQGDQGGSAPTDRHSRTKAGQSHMNASSYAEPTLRFALPSSARKEPELGAVGPGFPPQSCSARAARGQTALYSLRFQD